MGNPAKQLSGAARQGLIDTVKALLDRGADIHIDQDEPLRLAAANGHTAIVALLLDRGARIHADGGAALCGAALNGHIDTVRLLLDRDANIHALGDYALRIAAANGDIGMVALLLDRGANIRVHQNYVLCAACARGHWAVIDYLLAAYFEHKADAPVRTVQEIEDQARELMAIVKINSTSLHPSPNIIPQATLAKVLEKIEAKAILACNSIRRAQILKNPLRPLPPIKPRIL